MRLSREDKLKMYQLYKEGIPYGEINRYYPIQKSNFYYLMRLINYHGIAWLDRPYHYWTKEEKEEAINRVLLYHESQRRVAIELGLSSIGMLTNWIHDYQKNGYNVVNKSKGRPQKMKKTNQKKMER